MLAKLDGISNKLNRTAKKAAIYIRVSTKGQEKKGYGLASTGASLTAPIRSQSAGSKSGIAEHSSLLLNTEKAR